MTEQKMWCAIGKNGRYDYTSLSWQRKDCIIKFVRDCHPDAKTHEEIMEQWGIYKKKYGWRVERVFLTIKKIG